MTRQSTDDDGVSGVPLSRRQLVKRGAGLGLAAIPLLSAVSRASASFPGSNQVLAIFQSTSRFQTVWAATDQAVTNGSVSRTWIWGPAPISQQQEPYAEAPGGQRTVVYYDKARMEDNSYRASAPWDVTTGLLVKDLITGQRQIGDIQFENHLSAEINIAGDADDVRGPAYRTFKNLLDHQPLSTGATITQTVNRVGHVGSDASLANYGVTVDRLVKDTNHSIASIFVPFLDQYSGQPYGNPYYLTGFPITEPYWTTVKVAGVPRRVLIQAFERRALTYTPDNPTGWKIEMGNVGHHYHQWLYGPSSPPSETGIAYDEIRYESDGRILAIKDGNPVGRAIYRSWDGQWEWKTGPIFIDYTLRELYDALGREFGSAVFSYKHNDPNFLQTPDYRTITESIVNQLDITGPVDTQWVMGQFSSDDWQRVVTDWSSISQQLDTGQVPGGFPYQWDGADQLIAFAEQHGMTVRGQSLLWGGDVPDSIMNAGLQPSDLEKVFEFTLKVKMLKYKGKITYWTCVSEAVNTLLYQNDPQWVFWFEKLGGRDLIFHTFELAHATDPNAVLILAEDMVLEHTFLQPTQYQTFVQLLRDAKTLNSPIDGIDIENNFWVYDPPDESDLRSRLTEITDLGYLVATPETTVVASTVYYSWPSRPKVLSSVQDVERAQADIYAMTQRVYLDMNTQGFGVGGWGDNESWYLDLSNINPNDPPNAMICDVNDQPKPSYRALVHDARIRLNLGSA